MTASCKRPIPTQAGLRRPDLIFHQSGRSTFVLDITIVADNAVVEEAHSRKARYYDVPDIRAWIGATDLKSPLSCHLREGPVDLATFPQKHIPCP